MNEILELINSLIELLEKEKRITDIFSVPSKEKYELLRNELPAGMDNEVIYEQLHDTLTTFINIAPIEIIQLNDSERVSDQTNLIIQQSKYLVFLLNKFEANNNYDYLRKFASSKDFWKFIYLKCLLVIYSCSSSFEYDYSDENMSIIKQHVRGNLYYRGHSNSQYKIVPSMLRSLNRSNRINYAFITRLYQNSNLLAKYQNCVDAKSTVDYKFCSFIQHATSYSPLIDFSKKDSVALSFATHPTGNLNEYNGTDASLILLAVKTNSANIDINKIDIDYHAKKLSLNSKIYGKSLTLCTLSDFDVSFGICENATNDRMKYQQGVFFCFYKCVIVKGVPLLPWSKGYLLTLRIRCKDNAAPPLKTKVDIYNEIINAEPQYEYNHLMNPYDYFSEYNN